MDPSAGLHMPQKSKNNEHSSKKQVTHLATAESKVGHNFSEVDPRKPALAVVSKPLLHPQQWHNCGNCIHGGDHGASVHYLPSKTERFLNSK